MGKKKDTTEADTPAPVRAVCPDHPDAPQSPNGCTAPGCTYIAPPPDPPVGEADRA